MDIIHYTDEFFAMEKELNLFSQAIDGTPWWDPVRHDVFYFIYHRLSGLDADQATKTSFLLKGWRYTVRGLLSLRLWLKIKTGCYDFLVLRAPRNAIGTKRIDVILDDILACIPGKPLIINTFPHYYHVNLNNRQVKYRLEQNFCDLNREVESRFGQFIDVEELIRTRFKKFQEARQKYRLILDIVKPKLVLLVQNGIEKALFQSSHDCNIPVVEAQHGLINYVHPAYSYPLEISAGSLTTLPTFFLAFSDHWLNKCHYPVVQSVVTGNSQLFVPAIKTEIDDILVVSADIYEKAIEREIRPAAIAMKDRRFVYKLHPNQFAYKNEIRERLSDIPNIKVIANELSFRELLQRCSHALCIQSTGVYEALQAGLSVFLLAKLDFATHSDVFDHPNLRIVNDHKDFIHAVQNSNSRKHVGSKAVFFQEFDAEATVNFFASKF